MQNEDEVSVTALEWDSGTRPESSSLVFGDSKGHIGVFEVPVPKEEPAQNKPDPLVEDSLLMEVRDGCGCSTQDGRGSCCNRPIGWVGLV